MARVRLSVDVDPELRRRIKMSAAARDETVKDFLERAIMRELENGDEEEWEIYPSEGGKPTGLRFDAPRPKGGGNPVSDAVIEDRR